MSGTTVSSVTLDDPRRRKLLFRAWHRGMLEMDLILGPYADEFVGEMDAATLDRFEELMNENDQELYKWVLGDKAIPEEWEGPLLRSIIAHRQERIG